MIFLALLTTGCMFYFLVMTGNSAVRRLFVGGLFSLGLLFIFQPQLTDYVAHFVGIGRGADFIFYLSTLFLLCISFHFYLRSLAYEEKLTLIVRQIALMKPHAEPHKPRSGPVV